MLLHGKHFLFLSVLLYNDRVIRKAISKNTGEEMHRERFGRGKHLHSLGIANSD